MSMWTYVNGVVTVAPMGRTQAEKRYILDTVLSHLPKVTGSERDMNVYVVQKNGFSESSSHDEFEQYSNLGNEKWGYKHPYFELQREYLLVVDGSFRDREFHETYREFQKWLCRLAKRVDVEDVLVEIKGYDKSAIVRNPEIQSKKSWKTSYGQMNEEPTWSRNNKDGEPNWCEAFMWERAKNSGMPMMLEYKYYNNKENDEEVERRLEYERN